MSLSDVKQLGESLAKSAPFGAWVALLLLVTGGVGSVFSNEIKQTAPFTWHALRQLPPVGLFWALVGVSGLFLLWRQIAIDHARQQAQTEIESRANTLIEAQGRMIEAQGRMEEQADALMRTVRTMPPDGFLALSASLYLEADAALSTVFDPPPGRRDPELIAEAIRGVLRAVAILAQEFDRKPGTPVYSANLMVFRSSAELHPLDLQFFQDRLRFAPEEWKVEDLKGVLYLRKDLSTAAADEEADPLPEFTELELALAIPWRHLANHRIPGENRMRYRVVPGAPIAFVTRSVSQITDTFEIDTWCEQNTLLTTDEITPIVKYFEEDIGSLLRSFVSIALMPSYLPELGFHDPIGVLNIDCNEVGILSAGGETLEQFVTAVTPLRVILSKLLVALGEEEARRPATPSPAAHGPHGPGSNGT